MNSSTRGYYSIVQYCPDPSRLEAVNIGVALFCPEIKFLKASFGRRKTGVKHLFGAQDWEFFEVQKTALEARLSRQNEEFHELTDLETFVAKRASAFRMTPPRPVKVADPVLELKDLVRRLVGSPADAKQEAKSPCAANRWRTVSSELKDIFQAAGLGKSLKTNVSVHPPALPKPIKVPFAFQNGKLNLIEPVQFEGISPESAFHRASIHAVEGQFLTDYRDPQYGELALIIVGKFSPGQEEQRKSALAVFNRHNIPMHTFSTLEPLIEEIRLLAHG